MEVRIVIFLFFVFVTVTTNTVLIWLAYKAFSNLAIKATAAISEFQMSSETREWFGSMHTAAEQAVVLTETTKKAVADLEPRLIKAQESYKQTLKDVDSKLVKVEDEITETARKMRDVVAKPAFSVMAFAAGLAKVLETPQSDE